MSQFKPDCNVMANKTNRFPASDVKPGDCCKKVRKFSVSRLYYKTPISAISLGQL